MIPPDLAKVMRVLAVARGHVERSQLRRDPNLTWEIIRTEAREAAGPDLLPEFDRLFLAWEPAPDERAHTIWEASETRIRSLIDWLDAIVGHATLEMRVRADAELDAFMRRFPPRRHDDEDLADY